MEMNDTKLWEIPKAWINTLLQSEDLHGLVIFGEAGLGKTFKTNEILKALGKREGRDYVVRETKGTPLGLYIFLYENADKTIIIDDMMSFWSDETVRGILMSALWDKGEGRRYISWMTSRPINGQENEGETVPTRFEFKGKIIFLSNYIPEGEEFEPFLSRCLIAPEVRLNFAEKVAYFKDIAPKRGVSNEVLKFVFENVDDTFANFNFRTIQKVAQFEKAYPNKWKVYAKPLLVCDEELKILKELVTGKLPVEKQAEKYWELTGKSRASFYRAKHRFASRWVE